MREEGRRKGGKEGMSQQWTVILSICEWHWAFLNVLGAILGSLWGYIGVTWGSLWLFLVTMTVALGDFLVTFDVENGVDGHKWWLGGVGNRKC